MAKLTVFKLALVMGLMAVGFGVSKPASAITPCSWSYCYGMETCPCQYGGSSGPVITCGEYLEEYAF